MPKNPNINDDCSFNNYNVPPERPIYDEFFERAVSPSSERLLFIADRIALARINYLENQSTKHSVDRRNFTKAIAKKLFGRDWNPEPKTMSDLKAKESKIGSSIFGLRPLNERIEFFNDNRESWFFYQEITDSKNNTHSTTLHYEVRPMGVLKVSTKNGINCDYINGQERDNFIQATEIYYSRIMTDIYGIDPKLTKNL